MPTNHSKPNLRNTSKQSITSRGRQVLMLIIQPPTSRWGKRLVYGLIGTILVLVGSMYGIARWYIHTERGPQEFGISFIPDYAQSLGVDPQATMDALLHTGVKNLRLVSYWSDGEPQPGQYDFSQLDWQFQKAEAAHAHVTLSLGLRQPRWPECHMPDWAGHEPVAQWEQQLNDYITAVIARYGNSPALQSYQIENEYFLKGFGICESIPGAENRARLVNEYQLVKRLDGHRHTLILNRSNNAIGWPVGQPQPDEFGISVYKRVWDGKLTHRYLEYPVPGWFYAFTAGWQKLFTGKDMIVHELQAEAWAPNGQQVQNISLSEQNKSLNAQRLKDRFGYGKATGMRQIYLWGAEYWYYRQQVLHDPSLIQVAAQEFSGQPLSCNQTCYQK